MFLTKFKRKSGQNAGKIIDIPTSLPLTKESFCVFACITEQTFDNYLKKPGYETYFEVTKRMKSIIDSNQLDGASIGAFDRNIIALKLGLANKQEIEVKDVTDLKTLSTEELIKRASAVEKIADNQKDSDDG